ncbi:hypothetical protein CTRI78_v010289 [Colletotrichum trifolii]|uniref:Uncharacterized protein n=1 Tax=Colletotrichum trifolii TaxID=5466 RepID=A0A4R8QN22_COLTR|nr:hypothetical protein CTRI78_v010289 [Colletotrichum trifolii]
MSALLPLVGVCIAGPEAGHLVKLPRRLPLAVKIAPSSPTPPASAAPTAAPSFGRSKSTASPTWARSATTSGRACGATSPASSRSPTGATAPLKATSCTCTSPRVSSATPEWSSPPFGTPPTTTTARSTAKGPSLESPEATTTSLAEDQRGELWYEPLVNGISFVVFRDSDRMRRHGLRPCCVLGGNSESKHWYQVQELPLFRAMQSS